MTFRNLGRGISLFAGDCLSGLRQYPENAFDSCITDPPYEIGFMGRKWDASGIAFKSDFWREVLRVLKPGAHVVSFGATRGYHRTACAIEDAGLEIRDSLMWVYGTGFPKSHNLSDKWQGWGTALKPAFEPIVLARKPLSEPTVAANVLRWRTGALNIDGCRIETTENLNGGAYAKSGSDRNDGWGMQRASAGEFVQPKGRWPANVVHDGSDEVVGVFPRAKGAVSNGRKGKQGLYEDGIGAAPQVAGYADDGSAARFFYSAKASKADRAGSKHPTVKPVALMQWLCRLVTPPGGLILDPFAGSGTTGAAALAEGFKAVLCEREDEYVADIERRLAGTAEREPENLTFKSDLAIQ